MFNLNDTAKETRIPKRKTVVTIQLLSYLLPSSKDFNYINQPSLWRELSQQAYIRSFLRHLLYRNHTAEYAPKHYWKEKPEENNIKMKKKKLSIPKEKSVTLNYNICNTSPLRMLDLLCWICPIWMHSQMNKRHQELNLNFMNIQINV